MAGSVMQIIMGLVSANAPLLAVIGSSPVRCFPSRIPQPASGAPLSSQLPCLVYRFISGTPEYYLDGDPHFDHVRVQIDAYATTLSAADSLLQLARDAVGAGGRNVIVTDNGFDDETENNTWRRSFDVELWLG